MDTEKPLISIVMTVYNGSAYLERAINSMLSQTFTNFEFIIIDDGSSDDSLKIIQSIKDPRIVLIINPTNLGVSKSRNKGVLLAKGEFIAILDCDDMSLSNRLQIQLDFLLSNPKTGMIASTIVMIDYRGNKIGFWQDDIKNISFKELSHTLPITNCIAHSSIMIRASILKKNRYNQNLKSGEDYELWLRLLRDGVIINKIREPLIYYRIHSKSITHNVNAQHRDAILRLISVKKTFFLNNIFNFNFYSLNLSVALFTIVNIFEYAVLMIAELFIYLGSTLYKLTPNFIKSKVFLFFPFYHIGGAEKVHSQITECLAMHKPVIFFTHLSANQKFKSRFTKYAKTFDIVIFKKLPIFRQLLIGYLSTMISKTNNAVVFGCNSDFFYDLLPFLSPQTRKVDLLHAASGDGEIKSLPVVPYLDTRVVISPHMSEVLSQLYDQHGLDKNFLARINVIENSVSCPSHYINKSDGPIHILYVGRASNEKRTYLVGQIAKKCHDKKLPVYFNLIGNLKKSIRPEDAQFVNFLGELSDEKQIKSIYERSHILILTSRYEGFPLVIMEAMGHGIIPISTNVGGISHHIIHQENGFLIKSSDENSIIDAFVDQIDWLINNPDHLLKISKACYIYAKNNFDKQDFCKNYTKIILA